MDFTRDPIIETIITPREGFKLVIRSSKGMAQEEFFVDAVEVVSFGSAIFFRSLERPKAFLVPVTDYEVLEVREARMVLKNVGADRTIKIGGGRDTSGRGIKEAAKQESEKKEVEDTAKASAEVKPERKRERRRHSRRRRGKEEKEPAGKVVKAEEQKAKPEKEVEPFAEAASEFDHEERSRRVAAMLPPPTELISDTLDRYRDNELFRGVFEERVTLEQTREIEEQDEEKAGKEQVSDEPLVSLKPPFADEGEDQEFQDQ